MPNILVRNLAPQTLAQLKQRAKSHGRSLQAEARLLLEQGAASDRIQDLLNAWESRLAGRQFASSVELLGEDRDR